MKPKFYTAIRDAGGRVTELQFWFVHGSPSLPQIHSLAHRIWPEVAARHPERIVLSPGFNSFNVSLVAEGSALPLVEEKPPAS